MRIIALMNQKGGVGKTTTAVNLGAALAELGKRVCMVDMDPQAHLTINYGLEPSPDICSLYSVLVEGKGFLEAVHDVGGAGGNLALVPSSIDLAAAEIELVSVLGRELVLRKRIEAAQHGFDFIVLDCPPSLGLLTVNALAAAGEVIIPMQPHFLALQGVGKLLETVQLVGRRMNPKLKVAGIVLTMFDSQTKLAMEVVNDLNGFIESAKGKPLPWADARIFTTRIRRNIKLAESPSFAQTIFRYEPSSHGAADYRALACEILALSEGEQAVAALEAGRREAVKRQQQAEASKRLAEINAKRQADKAAQQPRTAQDSQPSAAPSAPAEAPPTGSKPLASEQPSPDNEAAA